MNVDNVTFTASTFAEAMAALPVDQRSAEANPDRDGAPNLIEHGFGTHPASSSSVPSLQPLLNEVDRTLHVRFQPPPGRSDISYLGESSADGISWQPITNTGHSGWQAFTMPLSEMRPLLRVRLVLH